MSDISSAYAQYRIFKSEETYWKYLENTYGVVADPHFIRNKFLLLGLAYNASLEEVLAKKIADPDLEAEKVEIQVAIEILSRILLLERLKHAKSIIEKKKDSLESEFLNTSDSLKLEQKEIKIVTLNNLGKELIKVEKKVTEDLHKAKKWINEQERAKPENSINQFSSYQDSIKTACKTASKVEKTDPTTGEKEFGMDTLTGGIKKFIQYLHDRLTGKSNFVFKSDSVKTMEKVEHTFKLK